MSPPRTATASGGTTLPLVVDVTPGSPAHRAGILPGDEIVAMDGQVPRDVIQYQVLAAEAHLELDVRRGGLDLSVTVTREGAEPLGIEVDAALFDQVRTCDNHCEFCFIYQLPKGMRKSLYLKDDDYRLSFLYGNFTTLTRFTEADLERVVSEGLSPLWVSIHATDPATRARLLRNRRGATSLRWLRALLDRGVEVHGQVVVCPGVNDGAVLADTLTGVLDLYPELTTLACVPLGVSRHSTEPAMRGHTPAEAAAVVDVVEEWQAVFLDLLGRRLVYTSDEYYLLARRPLPALETYESLYQHENGIGTIRAFEAGLLGLVEEAPGVESGFFHSVDGAPAAGYRSVRSTLQVRPRPDAPVAVVTGEYASGVLTPLVAAVRPDARVVTVRNEYFGGNIAVAGLMTGADVARALADQPPGHRYLLPDVCLSGDRFLDGLTPHDLPRPVEVVATDGVSLRRALQVGAI